MKELDRLRWKFMLYNMLIVTAVIGVTFCAAALLVKQRGRQEVAAVLSQAAEENAAEALIFELSSPVRVPYFSVVVQTDGSVKLQEGVYNSFPNQEFLEQVALMGMEESREQGALEDYSLRYLRVPSPEGYLIAFADTSYEEAMIDEMLVNGGIVCCVIWLGFLVLSYFFARWAVRPVADAMQHQRQFVADASHELKTPLTIITANAELLKDRCQGMAPEIDKWLDNVNQECVQMRHLVESLLMLARSDAAKKNHTDWEFFDFSDLLTEEILTFEPVFFQLGKILDYEICDSVRVRGSLKQLRQVIKILLDNAAKYSKETGQTEVRLELCGRKRICLWVKSEGNEIPKEQRTAIFRRFYRGDASRSSQDSYGLGLAIAQAIIKNHRGTMGVEWDGRRNCFYLKLKGEKTEKGRKRENRIPFVNKMV
ncbi:MAG: HAMP domain-containing sensor histidine kinase [Lachnospiraceae bacterium]|nr:HAMP domain-containing sensor histidine kinase [Lachnospiraceae bacterium]